MFIKNTFIVYSLTFIIGGITFVIYPISISLVCDNIDHSHIIRATGVLLFSYGIGAVIGPLAASAVMDLTGVSSGIFLYLIIILALYSAFGMIYTKKRRKILPTAEEQHVDFVVMPRQGVIANQLDPRTELEQNISDK